MKNMSHGPHTKKKREMGGTSTGRERYGWVGAWVGEVGCEYLG